MKKVKKLKVPRMPTLKDLHVPKGGLLNPGLRKGFGKIHYKP